MLPLPIENYIPKVLRDNLSESSSGQAFVDYLNETIEEIKNEILEMSYFKLPERCPNNFLTDLGFLLNAGIINTDSERTKRIKIKTAIETHKNRGTWENDAKLRIDAITGYSASLYSLTDSEDSIEMSGLSFEPDYYWSTESSGGTIDADLGTWEIGLFDEFVIQGNIYINLHEGVATPVLTKAIIDQIITDISDDIVPAYMKIFLGYQDSTGAFITYGKVREAAAYYDFSNPADLGEDATGNGNDGVDTDVTQVDGKFDKAGSFNGVISDISISPFEIFNGAFSFSCNINLDTLTGDSTIFGQTNYSVRFRVEAAGNIKVFLTNAGGPTGYNTAIGLITAGTDYNIQITYNNITSYLNVYINNVNVLSTDTGKDNLVLDLTHDFNIGSYAGVGEYFDGIIADFRIFNRVLTDAEKYFLKEFNGVPAIIE